MTSEDDGSWNTVSKKRLTAQEALKVAYSHLVDRVDQHKLAAIYGVNQGRINEAVKAVKLACDEHVRRRREGNGG